MDTEQAKAERLRARVRTADARLNELEASARARNARAEMDEIVRLREQRKSFERRLDDARDTPATSADATRREFEDDWNDFRRSLADAASHSAWDDARERRFNAHLDEIDAAVRRSSAQDAEVAAEARVQIAQAREDVKARLASARKKFESWRARRADEAAIRNLNASELELDEAFEDYAWAVKGVAQRATPSRSD
jgi:hypothetical protein